MANERDPSSELIARLHRVRIAGGLVLVAVAISTLRPLGAIESKSLVAAKMNDPQPPGDVRWIAPALTRAVTPLDLKAFDAPLWKLPPKPVEVAAVPPPAPPAPPPPLKLQLVGILTEPSAENSGATLLPARAALFDPDSNKIYTVPVGGAVLRYRVKSITSEFVELVDAQLPNLPPYSLKMRSSEFEPTPVIRDIHARGKSAKQTPAAAQSSAKDTPPPGELASGGSP